MTVPSTELWSLPFSPISLRHSSQLTAANVPSQKSTLPITIANHLPLLAQADTHNHLHRATSSTRFNRTSPHLLLPSLRNLLLAVVSHYHPFPNLTVEQCTAKPACRLSKRSWLHLKLTLSRISSAERLQTRLRNHLDVHLTSVSLEAMVKFGLRTSRMLS